MSDDYQPTPLPAFIEVAMGLRAPTGTPVSPLTEVVQTTELVERVTPNSSDMSSCEQHVPPASRSRPPDEHVKRSEPIQGNPPPREPRKDDEVPPATSPSITTVLGPNSQLGRTHITEVRSHTRDERLNRAVKATVTAVLAVPVWLIVIFLLVGLLSSQGDRPVVVNTEPGCKSGPITIAASELATRRYWEEC